MKASWTWSVLPLPSIDGPVGHMVVEFESLQRRDTAYLTALQARFAFALGTGIQLAAFLDRPVARDFSVQRYLRRHKLTMRKRGESRQLVFANAAELQGFLDFAFWGHSYPMYVASAEELSEIVHKRPQRALARRVGADVAWYLSNVLHCRAVVDLHEDEDCLEVWTSRMSERDLQEAIQRFESATEWSK